MLFQTSPRRLSGALVSGVFLAGGACLFLSGCGDGRAERVPVSGQVLIDGAPLTHGLITFLPENGRQSAGELDGEGRFTLTSFTPNDGAVRGHHSVAIDGCEALSPEAMKYHAPRKYANASTSGITKDITGPVSDMKIEISWEGGKPFIERTGPASKPGAEAGDSTHKGKK